MKALDTGLTSGLEILVMWPDQSLSAFHREGFHVEVFCLRLGAIYAVASRPTKHDTYHLFGHDQYSQAT